MTDAVTSAGLDELGRSHPGGPAPLGGNADPVTFTESQVSILNAAADEIVPAGGGFPAPSAVGVAEFIARYVTPYGHEPSHYPFVAEAAFKMELDALGGRFLQATSAERVEMLQTCERERAVFFAQLRDLVYYAYYSKPAVTAAINEHLEAGRDYHGPPQPAGYLRSLEAWDEDKLARGRGRYIPTEGVTRVSIATRE